MIALPRRFWIACVAAAVIAVSIPHRLCGQAIRGSVVGTITDSTGAIAPGVSVEITDTGTGYRRTTLTNQEGGYVFPALTEGVYRVVVEHPGFRREIRDGIDVAVNATVRVDLQMVPGQTSESIEVHAEAPDLQADRSDTGRNIEREEIADMPLGFNRNYEGLIVTVPGVSSVVYEGSGFYNAHGSMDVYANGLPPGANNFEFEGTSNFYRSGNLTGIVPPIEALAEVSISTSNYEAEFGMAGGVVANVILRSGTNAFHGSAFEFNRVAALEAKNVFANTKAPTTFNLFGGTFGGPIIKNRTFIFVDFQGITNRLGYVNVNTIPTEAFRTGDLSQSPTTIYDPATGNPDGTNRLPFAGNQIPPNRISHIAQSLLAFLPSPTFSGLASNFQKNFTEAVNTNSFDVKLDHRFNDHDTASVRYSFQRPVTSIPGLYGIGGGPSVTGDAGNATLGNQNAQLAYTHIFSPSFLVETRFGLLRYRNDARNLGYGTDTSQQVGIPGINTSAFTGGLTSIDVGGYDSPMLGFPTWLPWLYAETHFNVVNNWTKVVGGHTIKWGVDARRYRDDEYGGCQFGVRGSFYFTAGPTALNGNPNTSFGNSFAAFLLDQPSSLGRDVLEDFPTIRQTMIGSYIQDKWQVSRKLTLDFGLRHEAILPISAGSPGRLSIYDSTDNTVRVAGIGSVPMNLGVPNYSYRYFAPRLGLAYRMNEKTVFRAGYGISFNPNRLAVYAATNIPVTQEQSINALNSFTAAGSMAMGFPAPALITVPSSGIITNAPDLAYQTLQPNVSEGYVQSWNMAIQRALPKKFTFEAAYVGNLGVGVKDYRNVNASMIPGSGAAGQPLYAAFGRLSPTTEIFYPTNTDYNSLQAKFDRKFSGGFLLTTAYTFGKGIDYSEFALAIPAFPFLNRGRTGFDATQTFVQSYIYELPFGRNKRWFQSGAGQLILGGWQVNGIFTRRTGFPLDFTYDPTSLNAPGNGNQPNLVGTPQIFGNVGVGALWFDTSKFSAPAPATFGTVGRNVLHGPGLVDLDFSLFRHFRITERLGLELRFEALNFSNTPHFNNPDTNFGDSSFGQVTTALQDSRQVQLGAKLSF